jgi:MFS family permease
MSIPDTSVTPERAGVRSLPRNVWVVTLTSFLTDISSEMVFNLLPLFLASTLGVRTSVIGVIEGIADTTASLIKVFSGWWSDRLGSRKGLAVAGYGLSTVAKPFLYLATSWGGVLIVRFADRVGKGIRTAPRDALVAATVDEGRRGLAFGLHRAGDTAGAALGLVLALIVVLAAQGDQVALSRDTFQTVVLLSVIPAALAVLVLAFGAHEVRVKEARAPVRLTLRGLDRRYRLFLLVIVLFTLGNSADAFLILRANTLGLSVAGVMGLLIVFNIVYSLISEPAGALSDRVGRQRLLLSGWLLYAAVYLGFALVNAAWQVWLLYALYGVYYGLTYGVSKALVADLVPRSQLGTAYGVYDAAVGLMALPASLIAGVLWQGVGGWRGLGASAPFAFGAIMALLAAALLPLALRRPQES